MPRFFRSQNVGQPLTYYDLSFKFEPFDSFAGLLRGCYVAREDAEGYVLGMLADDPSTGITEISQTDWETVMRRAFIPDAPPPVQLGDGLKNKVGLITSDPFKPGAKSLPPITCEAHRSQPVTIVELGRFGDVINVLPVAWALSKCCPQGKTRVVASVEFSNVLDGCSYVDGVNYSGHYANDYLAAVKFAQDQFGGDVRATQLYFHGSVHGRVTPSFVLDSWLKAGMAPQLWDEFPLVFDNRDAKREKALVDEHYVGKPMLLYNVSGTSSPLNDHRKLVGVMKDWSKTFNLVDVGSIKAHRIYDLLGLMDEAVGFITSDTSTLHLAGAARCPYIALITDQPTSWHGSKVRGNCMLQVRYGALEHELSRISETIGSFEKPVGHHLWTSPLQMGPEPDRRHRLALGTWKKQGWIEHKVGDYLSPRLFSDGLRYLPYLKDMIDIACARARERDYVVLTNADIMCSSKLNLQISEALKKSSCLWINRRDFQRLDQPLNDWDIKNGHEYSGTDLFAFKVSWWAKVRDSMPDMMYGAEGWDLCMRVLMQESNGRELRDLIYHERHTSTWETAENRMRLPSQLHNRKLARKFCVERGHDPKPHGL